MRIACSRRSVHIRRAAGVLAGVLLSCAAFAETAADLTGRVRSALTNRTPDAEIAALIRQVKLSDRLDEAMVEAVEAAGAGPLTIAAMERQRDNSESLPPSPWKPAALAAPPPADERARIVAHATTVALDYSAGLPNFVCTETVRRYSAKKRTDEWTPGDTLVVDVASNGKEESYHLLTINGWPTTKSLRSVAGFTATGEFDSLQRFIFDPKSKTVFVWQRWAEVRGRNAHVFAFHIDQQNSEYRLNFQFFLKRYRATTAARGLVYLDAGSHKVLRLRLEAEGIPANWPILRTPSVLDYDFAEVGGEQYLLPQRFEARVVMKNGQQRNVTEFGRYRRFSAEATINFEKQ